MRAYVFFTFMILLTGILGACAPEKKISAGLGVRSERPEVVYVGGNWTPADVHLTCEGAHCRPYVGVFLTSQRVDPGHITLTRCTATLIANDQILTSGHCVLEGRDAYFVLPNGFRKISRVDFKTPTVVNTPRFGDITTRDRIRRRSTRPRGERA